MDDSILEQLNKKKERLENTIQNHIDYEDEAMVGYAIQMAKIFLDNTEEGLAKKEELFLKFKIAEAKLGAYTDSRNATTGILTF